MRMNNISVYQNKSPDAIPMAEYYQDENGIDWYESREDFKKKWIVGFNKDGVVCVITNDVQSINPAGLSIMDFDDIPEGMNISGGWKFDGKKLIQSAAARTKELSAKKARLMREVSDDIAALEDAATLGFETKEEVAELKALREYRIALKRLDIEDKNLIWPKRP